MKRLGTVSRVIAAFSLVGAMGFVLAGCGTTYYQVTDTNSGKVYYTTKVKKSSSGAVSFKDARSGAEVTVQASEYHTVSETTYNAGVSGAARPEDAGN
jgi:starvation-inducible outer membrane lipoprotein